MRINRFSLRYTLLIMCILLQGLFFHIISPSSLMTMLLLGSIIALWGLSFTIGYNKECIFINRYLLGVFIVVVIPHTMYGIVLGQSLNDYIDVMKGMVYILLATPVLKMLLYEKSLDKIFNMITLLTTISLVLLIVNSFFLNEFGTSLFPFEYFQMPATGRNSRLRLLLISDFLSFVVIYSFCNLFFRKSKKKLLFLFSLITAFTAEIYIEQTRMIVMALIASCMLVFTLWLKRKRYKFPLYLLVIFLVIYGVYDNWFSGLFASFSIDNSSTGVSTLYRTIELTYASQLIMEHPILGTGMVKDYLIPVYMQGHLVMFDHTDIGLIGCVTYIGILGASILFIWPFVRFTMYIYKVPKKLRYSRDYFLLCGLLTYIALTSLTILITDNARIFVWPFIIAIFEFCRCRYGYRVIT